MCDFEGNLPVRDWVYFFPRPMWYSLGRVRSFYWGVVRSEKAHRRMILRAELAWSGKGLNPEELDELMVEQRPSWRRR